METGNQSVKKGIWRMKNKKILPWLLAVLVLFVCFFGACGNEKSTVEEPQETIDVDLEEDMEPLDEAELEELEEGIAGDDEMEADVIKEESTETASLDEDGSYTSKEDVAAYLYAYGHLPSNFITKKEAQELGWDSKEGNLDEVAPGKSIGGDTFGNYDKMLPVEDGRTYRECDVNYEGGYRGSERIVYSNDGLIFYSDDHYETFTRLY